MHAHKNIRGRVSLAVWAGLLAFTTGCMSVTVEDDGVQVGNRDALLMVNPAGQVASDLRSYTELTYEKTISPTDSSLFTIGIAEDARKEVDSSLLFVLAGGRYYMGKQAPAGFFMSGDVGFGEYAYRITDNRDYNFLYGAGLGYKFMIDFVALDLGATFLHTYFEEGIGFYTKVLRVQAGVKF
ncbi:MAG: hypothetical protein ABIF71_05050 [Planctomycetota bacterium]